MGWGGDRLCQTKLIPRSPDGDNNDNDLKNFGVDDNETGILGLVLQFITPLTIAPSVAMIGLR